MESIRDSLKWSSLFVRLEDEELDLLLKGAATQEYAPGDVIMAEGASGDCLYFILEGSVEIIKRSRSGSIRLICLERNECFGEMSLIDIEPRSASAVAATHTRVLAFAVEDLAAIFSQNEKILPLLVTNIARILSRRLRAADERIIASEQKGE